MTGDAFRFLATDQAADLGLRDARVVVEPVGRDTAPAILTAALMLEDTPEALMLVAPSDHVIGDVEAFRGAVLRGAEAARTGAFVTFGVTPGPSRDGLWLPGARRHARERRGGAAEKLPREARPRDRGGDACPGRLPVERGHLPDAGGRSDRRPSRPMPRPGRPLPAAIETGAEDLGFFRLGAEAYGQARAISFDYAIMEKAERVMAVPLTGGWSDLGAWDALWQEAGPDAAATR
jgi:mannose-1-phosphate guanylyltransferase/mannose-6-phosphate isomerase